MPFFFVFFLTFYGDRGHSRREILREKSPRGPPPREFPSPSGTPCRAPERTVSQKRRPLGSSFLKQWFLVCFCCGVVVVICAQSFLGTWFRIRSLNIIAWNLGQTARNVLAWRQPQKFHAGFLWAVWSGEHRPRIRALGLFFFFYAYI